MQVEVLITAGLRLDTRGLVARMGLQAPSALATRSWPLSWAYGWQTASSA